MLARTFKTAEQLGITQAQFEALKLVMEKLERGELRHVDWANMPEPNIPNGFNMNIWDDTQDCGSVCCIGGWAEKLTGVKIQPCSENYGTPFYTLFFPDAGSYDHITAEQAAQAIHNYLSTGEAQWAKVVGDDL